MTESITHKIHQWVLQHFPAADQAIGIDDSLLDSGIVDSMGTLEIVEYLEDEFGIEMSDEDMVADHFESVSSIAAYVKSRLDWAGQSESTPVGPGSPDDNATAS